MVKPMNVGSRVWQPGFTLLELLITLAVMVIISSAAVSGFHYLVASKREASTEIAIRSGLNLARSEAIKRHESVSLIANTKAALLVQLDNETLRQINLPSDVEITLGAGAVTYTSLGRLAAGSGSTICAMFDGDHSLYFELSQAGGLNTQKAGRCNG